MMRKALFSIGALLALLSCVRESEERGRGGTFPAGAPVTVTFTLNDMAPAAAGTKALGENVELTSLHLAVFGSSGYLKEYVTATPVKMAEKKVYTIESGSTSTPVEVQVDQYTFTATLSLTESKRYVHLIGNGPDVLDFGYDNQVLPSLLCSDGGAVFWQMIELPNGIRAAQDEQLRYLYIDGTPHEDGDTFNTPFMPDKATSDAFNNTVEGVKEGIPMVRNWAKLELTAASGSHFTPYSFVAVNVPRQGTFVPYSGSRKIINSYPTGFITDYQDLSFTDLDETLEYAANLPSSVYFNTSVPNRLEFETPSGWAVDLRTSHAGTWNDPNPGFYLYERPVPSDEMLPTYVIVFGHYKNDDDPSQAAFEDDYFYKIDLMEGDRYYPIYRNFKYEIEIQNISAPGFDTPQAAMLSAGSGDVSSNINASALVDISDGTRRLVIRPSLDMFFTEAQSQVQVFAAFYTNLSASSSPETTTNRFSLELNDPDDGDTEHPVIIGPALGAAADENGFWPITFSTPAPAAYRRSQILRVNATSDGVTMYRDITVTVQGIQAMQVQCQKASIPRWQGSPQVVDILIPNGLPRAMFSYPLDFTIEAENLTLTPDNSYTDNSLPVVSGTSITEDYAGQTVFQFVRSLSWTEYRALPLYTDSNAVTWRRISCYFKSNCDESATRVWVSNPYFTKAWDSFVNHNTFGNVKFTTSIPLEADAAVKVNVSVPMMGDDYPQVRLILKNLTPAGSDLVPDNDTEREDDYLWTPTAESTELSFSTGVDTGDVSLELSAVDGSLESLSLKPWKFSSWEFVAGRKMLTNTNWSNVIRGHVNKAGKQALFGYMDDPDAPDAPITIKNLTNLTVSGLPSTYATVPFVPQRVGSWKPYHQFDMNSKNGLPASFTISSVGYVDCPVTANCFSGDLTPLLASTDDVFRPGNSYKFTVDNPTYTVSLWSRSCKVSFDKISAIQSMDPAGIVLDAGGEYNMTVTSQTSGFELVQIAIDYLADYDWYGTVQDMMPASIVSSTSGSSVIRYLGNRATQIVVIPTGGIMESTITLRAPADHPIVITGIIPLTFKGTLND